MNVPTAALPATLQRLKDEGYRRLVDITAIDDPSQAERFELNYLLYSMDKREWLRVKARTSGQAPTACGVFAGANAYEREVYDMFGVEFSGHPLPRRILMPDDWVGHPLRRDEPLGSIEVDFTFRRAPRGD
ncbi:MAG TPA: NADH-quinone oxidoreductase subunit C [Chloroflexota bacterium]|nr:NADH-quinone oxidoreductase subunit C [Chloroflexota bacterium]